MKPILICAALAGSLVLTGCDTPALLSLDPFAAPGEAVVDPALAGVWEAGENDICVIRQTGATGYTVAFHSDGLTRKFDAVLFRVANAEFLDLVPSDSGDFSVPAHALARVWPESARLRWAYVDTEWFRGQAAAVPSRPLQENKLLLTGAGAAVRALLANAAGDERAHGDVTEWKRLP